MRHLRLSLLLALALTGPAAATAQAASTDSLAPPNAPAHWLPPEAWVSNHWIPYDEGSGPRCAPSAAGP